jgi:hypothetical protein
MLLSAGPCRARDFTLTPLRRVTMPAVAWLPGSLFSYAHRDRTGMLQNFRIFEPFLKSKNIIGHFHSRILLLLASERIKVTPQSSSQIGFLQLAFPAV